MKIENLQQALTNSWSVETCYPTDRKIWTKEKPGTGQCAVTALVVWYFLGGEILEIKHATGRAFFNRLPDGQVIDLSGQNCQEEEGPMRIRDPKTLLVKSTKHRFELLLKNIESELENLPLPI